MTVSHFGRLDDGRPVDVITLSAGPLTARVLSYGAILADLVLATAERERSLVLGYDGLDAYVAQDAYLGAVAGRCANRIRDGRFELDGAVRRLARNDGGRHHLHGGDTGFDKRLWTIAEAAPDAVTLTRVSPDGEEGYPGTIEVRCRYALDPSGLTITLSATTDAPTLVNLATHAYFALDDDPTILDHHLEVPADRWTPVDGDLIPTGELAPVAGTPFDFRRLRPIRDPGRSEPFLYDHNLVLSDAPAAAPRQVARLLSPKSGVSLAIASTEPGLQVYTGNFLPPKAPLRGGRPMVRHGGICLEPQRFPDAIHHPRFAGAVLRPGETYRQVTRYDVDAPA